MPPLSNPNQEGLLPQETPSVMPDAANDELFGKIPQTKEVLLNLKKALLWRTQAGNGTAESALPELHAKIAEVDALLSEMESHSF